MPACAYRLEPAVRLVRPVRSRPVDVVFVRSFPFPAELDAAVAAAAALTVAVFVAVSRDFVA